MRIVQVANLVTPTSGGIRSTLAALGRGYAAAGHQRVEIVPGPAHDEVELGDDAVRRVLPGVPLPGGAGYRLLLDRTAVRAALRSLSPDAIEVHDRFTLPWVVGWASQRGIPATVVVHERLSATLATWARLGPVGPGPLARTVARAVDRRLLERTGSVVVASRYAAAAFGDDARVDVVPFGVDLQRFHPGLRERDDDGPLRLALAGRLTRDKRPAAAIATLAELRLRGVDAHLEVLGDGPLRPRLERLSAGLPVRFHGHVAPDALARVLADADVALAPCPAETFGLAALEAMACGTPVVGADGGALPELLGTSPIVRGHGGVARAARSADLVEALLRFRPACRRTAARRRAERFGWHRLRDHLLARHGAAPLLPCDAGVVAGAP